MRYILTALLISITFLDAKIIEVEQLFNKKTTTVKKQNFSIIKEFYANSSIIENNIVDVVTRFDGFITKLYANKTYMIINKNQPLFSLYSQDIDKIHGELQISKNLDKELFKSSIKKLEVLDISRREINKIKKTRSFEKVTIYSPINGVVLKKNINDKSAIKKGKLLLQLANMDKMWVIVKIYQKDLNSIKKGQKVKIYFDGLNRVFESTIDYIYPNIESKSKTVDVRVVVDNKNYEIFPNMFAKIKIQVEKKSILTLPKTAVLNKASKYYVFQPISKSEFEPIEVEVKRISSNSYQILDGLEEGQKVIDNALFLLDSDAVTNTLYDEDDGDW